MIDAYLKIYIRLILKRKVKYVEYIICRFCMMDSEPDDFKRHTYYPAIPWHVANYSHSFRLRA